MKLTIVGACAPADASELLCEGRGGSGISLGAAATIWKEEKP